MTVNVANDGGVTIDAPYLLFLGDAKLILEAKTASGLAEWRGDLCVGQVRLPGCEVDLGLPDITPKEAADKGVKTMIIGIAPIGGEISSAWVSMIVEAITAGLDIAAGMHQRLANIPEVKAAAKKYGSKLIDVRHAKVQVNTGSGRKRTGKRVLTVGTDCAIGKKYTALALEKALHERSAKATFRATGQTGIMIAGRGVAVDSVISDFISGAAEWLSPDNEPDHWDVIEGQGSLYHPAYAGVTLGLMHGSQPDALVVCHEPVRNRILSVEGYPLPDLKTFIETSLHLARITNPAVVVAGISINTSRISEADAIKAVEDIEALTGLPCCDPICHGAGKLADQLLKLI